MEADKIKTGEILVTKQTDPGWAMVFPIIGGLIVERGGALSHGAIVAREFGIPAVLGIENITEILKDNDEVIDKPEDLFVEPPTVNTPPIKVDDVPDVIDVPEEVNILAVEQVPVYPGCESLKTNIDKRACMEQKLAKLIDRKFDREIASNYGLSGVQKIYVQFKIDKSGNVVDVKTRAPHKALAKEAEKVINKVPQMQPGKQAQKPVNVIYSLPIIFQVQD